MISLPTLQANSWYGPEGYFNEFTRDAGRGRVGDRFDAVGVHTYSSSCLNSGGTAVEGLPGTSPLYILERAKQSGGAPLYLTEVGLNFEGQTYAGRYGLTSEREARSAEMGRRYVNALEAFDTADGRVKGVTIYQTHFSPRDDDFYQLDYFPNNPNGPFYGHEAMGYGYRAYDCQGG